MTKSFEWKYVVSFLSIKDVSKLQAKFHLINNNFLELKNRNELKDFNPALVYFDPVVHLAVLALNDPNKTPDELCQEINDKVETYKLTLTTEYSEDLLNHLQTFWNTNFNDALKMKLKAETYEEFVNQVRERWNEFKLNPSINSYWHFISYVHNQQLGFFNLEEADFSKVNDEELLKKYFCFSVAAELEYKLIQLKRGEGQKKKEFTRDIILLNNYIVENKIGEDKSFTKNVKTKLDKEEKVRVENYLKSGRIDQNNIINDLLTNEVLLRETIPLAEESYAVFNTKTIKSRNENKNIIFTYPGLEYYNKKSKSRCTEELAVFFDKDSRAVLSGVLFNKRTINLDKFIGTNQEIPSGLTSQAPEEKETAKPEVCLPKKSNKVYILAFLASAVLVAFYVIGYRINKLTSLFQGGIFRIMFNLAILSLPLVAGIFLYFKYFRSASDIKPTEVSAAPGMHATTINATHSLRVN